jgi:hypothetical protein
MPSYNLHADMKLGPELLNAAGLSREHKLDEVDVDWLKCHHVFMFYPLLFHESQDGGGRPRRYESQLAIHEVT